VELVGLGAGKVAAPLVVDRHDVDTTSGLSAPAAVSEIVAGHRRR
jgi:hypothetical protein